MLKRVGQIVAASVLAAGMAGSVCAQTNLLVNGGFEQIAAVAKGWQSFGNVYSINFYQTSGGHCIKMYGPFNATPGYSGIYQDVAAKPGDVFTATGNARSPLWDSLSWDDATNSGTRVFLEIQYLDASKNVLTGTQQYHSDKLSHNGGNEPPDVTVLTVAPTDPAPAGTAFVRVQMIAEQGNYVGGSAFVDDIDLHKVGGNNVLTNPSFEEASSSSFAGWTNFGNGGRDSGHNQNSGAEAAKLWGGYNGDPAYSGWWQDVPATGGQKLQGSAFGRSDPGDSLQVGNDVFLQLEFYDTFGNLLLRDGFSDHVPTPGDGVYRQYTTTPVTAPQDTVSARFVIVQVQHGYVGGATWWDDASLVALCPSDFNNDGFTDIYDFTDFVTCFEGGDCPAGSSADFNGDGFPDIYDFTDFVDAFEAGCP